MAIGGGIWQSEHDFRDKHASQFTTGRFVLLPKNLVTGAAKARIVSRATCMGRVPLEELTMKPRLSRGFFLAEDRCVMHKVEALIWAAIFAVALIAFGLIYATGPTYVLQSFSGEKLIKSFELD